MLRPELRHGQPLSFAQSLNQGSETRALTIKAARARRDLFPDNTYRRESLLKRAMEGPYARTLSLLIMGGAAASLSAACSQTPPAEIQESPTPTPTPYRIYLPFMGNEPESTPTLTSIPTATATKESTPTSIPPTRTPEPTAASTPEKKLYPDYGVSSGIATTADGKNKRGMVMVSYLPSPVGKWCVYYFLQGNSRRGEVAYLFTLNKTGINSFQSAEKRYDKIQVSFGENGSLSGTIDWGGGEERFAFQLSFQGQGRRILLDGYKGIKISEQALTGGIIPDQQAIDYLARSGITLP